MKIGLDIHGVITDNYEFFSELSYLAKFKGYEIQILTGASITEEILSYLKGIYYTKIFSITDHHKKMGTNITYTDPNNPWIEDALWDKAKAEYCSDHQISFHIDDTKRYGDFFFKTPFAHYVSKNKCVFWKFLRNSGSFSLGSPESFLEKIEGVFRGVVVVRIQDNNTREIFNRDYNDPSDAKGGD